MEVAPLIYSRTGQCDYNSKFAVRPKGFSEIQWARNKILAAMRNISRYNGIRRIVASKNGVCVAGIVCTMKYFVNECLNGLAEAQPYSHIRGTLYGVFLGYAFNGNTNEIPDVNYSDLWQWFNKYLAPEWEKKSARTVEVDYFSFKSKSAPKINRGVEFYDSAAVDEEKIFEEYLARALTEDVAFCSNVENIQAVEEDEIYTAVTTSAGNIAKLKENAEKKRREREEQKRRKQEEAERQRRLEEAEKKTRKSTPHINKPPSQVNNPAQTTNPTPQSESTSGKSILPILLIILIIIGAIIYWWTN